MHSTRQQQMKNFILDKRRGLLVHFSLKYSALLVYVRLGLSLDELVELSLAKCGLGWGGGGVKFLLYISSSLVSTRLHTETELNTLPGSALKVCGGGWVGGG